MLCCFSGDKQILLFQNLKSDCETVLYRLRYGETKQLLRKRFFYFLHGRQIPIEGSKKSVLL